MLPRITNLFLPIFLCLFIVRHNIAQQSTLSEPIHLSSVLIVNGQKLNWTDSISVIGLSQHIVTADLEADLSTVKSKFVNRQPIENEANNFDKDKAVWLNLKLENPRPVLQTAILFFGFEQDVTIYDGDQIYKTGSMVSLKDKQGSKERGLFLRDEGYSSQVVFEISAEEKRDLYVRLHRNIYKSFTAQVKLYQPSFWEKETAKGSLDFWQGIFQGIIWALIIYHFLFFIGIREMTYLYYCIYMVCISCMTLGDFGYWQYDLWGNHPYVGWCFFQVLQYLTGIMTFVFMQSFVQLDRILPKWDKIVTRFIQVNLFVLGLIILAYFITQDARIAFYGKLLIVPFTVLGVIFCYLLIKSRDRVAIYFALAGGMLAIAILINGVLEIRHQWGHPIGTNYTRFYIIQVAAIAHLMTFAFGMSYRRRLKDIENQRTLEMEEMRSQFYTNITHEFRTPLTVIQGMTEQVNGHGKIKRIVRRNTDNLLRLINQLLDMSKLEHDGLKLKLEQGNIIAYLNYLSDSFDTMAREKEIELLFYAEEDEVLMDFDREKIQQVIYNLLSNAIKFTEKGGKVIVHAKLIDKGKQNRFQLKVKDSGIGIPKEYLPNIFNRFYQVESSHTRKGEGTGIGLALTKELIKLMKGEIEVSSEFGKGTTFKIVLPITNNAEQTGFVDVKEPPVLALVNDVSDLGLDEVSNITAESIDAELPLLLLVEDNTDVATYMLSILRDKYQVVYAKDGGAGIEKAKEIIPDMIISDVMMPVKDGFELCETLKQNELTSHIPVILLTAKANQEAKIAGLQYGADAYLTKPFNQKELLLRLKNLQYLSDQMKARYASSISQLTAPTIINDQPDPEQQFLNKLEKVVLDHLSEVAFSVPEFAKAVNMSQMQVYRKLKALTSQTPSQFIRRVRLDKGREMIVSTDLNISEIAYEVGFSDPNYFTRSFQKEFKLTPTEARKKNT